MRSGIRLGGVALTALSGLLGAPALAQVTPYTATHDGTATFSRLPSGTDHVPTAYGSADRWDEGAARIPLPFDFDFFGTRYDTVWAFTNGFVSFEPPPGNVTVIGPATRVPDPGGVDAYIAPLWQDLDRDRTMPPTLTPRIRTEVTGAVGRRRFFVEYTGLRRARASTGQVEFRITLYEGTQRIQLLYGNVSGVIDATAALEGPSGRDGFDVNRASATCSGNCPCGPASCSANPGQNLTNGLEVTFDLPPTAELVGGVEGPPGAAPGASFDAQVSVRNAGLVSAGASDHEVYLSSSPTSTASAFRLGRFRSSALAELTTETTSRRLTVPANAPVGTLFLVVVVDADDEVSEAIETNNLFSGGPFRTGPELRVGGLEGPRVTGPGETLPVTLAVENAGAPVGADFDVRFWLSADDRLDPGDFELDTLPVGLPDGFAFSGGLSPTVPLNVPLSPPDYRLLVELDAAGTIPEVDETNNVGAAALPVEVRGPQLVVRSVRSATVAVRGAPYPVRLQVANEGGARARGVTACVLSRGDPNLDLAVDRRLAVASAFDLAAGEEARVDLEPILPAGAPSSERFLGGGIDCARTVMEPQESDNVRLRSGGPVEIRDPAPDFGVDELDAPARVAAGEAAQLTVRLSNRGRRSGAAPVAIFLSEDAVLDPADPEVGRSPAVRVDPGASLPLSIELIVPVEQPSGDAQLFAWADPEELVLEVDEDDNESAGAPTTVLGPSLAVVGGAPPPARIGRSFAWRFSALGPEPERAWDLEWGSGSAPDGLAFDGATGELSGVAEAAAEGAHPYVVQVRSGGEFAERRGTLIVEPPGLPLTVVTRRLPPALRGEAYDEPLIAAGGAPPYQWRLAAGAELTLGLGLSNATGRISGRPGVLGAQVFEVVATDRFGRSAVGPIALEVIEPEVGLRVTTAAVAAGVVNEPYATRFAASGAVEAVAWRLVEGGAPGLRLSSAGDYTGTPTEVGLFPVVVEVREPGSGRSDRAAFVLEIIEQGDLRILGEAELPEGRLGVPYPRTRLEAAPEAPGSTWSVLAGRLPPGVELAPDGTLEGSPGEEGVFAFLVQVRTPSNERRRATRAIRVVDPADATEVAGGGGCRCARADRSPRRSRGGLASSGGLTGGRSGPLVALLIGGLMLTPLAGRRGRRRPGQRGEP